MINAPTTPLTRLQGALSMADRKPGDPVMLSEWEAGQLVEFLLDVRKLSDALQVYGYPVSDAHWANRKGGMSLEARALHLAAYPVRQALTQEADRG